MGFLLGAFGKLAAGRRMRSLQARMMRVQSRARRVSRDVEKMEKMLQRQEKAETNALNYSTMASTNMAQQSLYNTVMGQGDLPTIIAKMQGGKTGELTSDEQTTYNNAFALMNQQLTTMKTNAETQKAQMQQQIEDKYEMLREQMLEPLKDEEEELQTEKDSLESQYQIAKGDYDACKEMEKSDAKNLAPNYTGGQG